MANTPWRTRKWINTLQNKQSAGGCEVTRCLVFKSSIYLRIHVLVFSLEQSSLRNFIYIILPLIVLSCFKNNRMQIHSQ